MRYNVLLLCIILVAFVLRFYQLGQVPLTLNWDEASFGYNAYSILLTGKDEYGKSFPFVLQSFNDYKPALYAYFAIPSIFIFGLNNFAVRLPAVIFGVLGVIGIFFLVLELFSKSKWIYGRDFPKQVALLSSFLLAISPWHIQFSRAAYEASVGVTFTIFFVLFFLKGLKNGKYFIGSSVCAILTVYTYQSEKVFVPLLLLGMCAIFYKDLLKASRKYIGVSVVIGFILVLPMLLFTVGPHGLARAQGASFLNRPSPVLSDNLVQRVYVDVQNNDVLGKIVDNRRVVYGKAILGNYLSHFDLNWLIFKGYHVSQHQAPFMGKMYIFELPFLLIGLYGILVSSLKKKYKFLLYGWIVLTPIPAAFTWDVPNPVRTLNWVPILYVFIAFGMLNSYYYLKDIKVGSTLFSRVLRWGVLAGFAVFALINIGYYLNQYFIQYNRYSSAYWQYGYQELVGDLEKIKHKYKAVYVSSNIPLDQSYIFFLYTLKFSPDQYQRIEKNRSGQYEAEHFFDKYIFRVIDFDKESPQPGYLYVIGTNRTKDNIKGITYEPFKTYHFLDGSKSFVLIEKK